MNLALVLTNDWELFGDGSGDYFEIQHKPTLDLLNVLKDHNAKITLMAEVAQQFGFKSISQQYPWAKEVSSAWEEIVKQTIKMGNDVQLHYHPQWIGANYDGQKWALNEKHWSIAHLEKNEMKDILSNAKIYLEGLIKEVKPDYKCIGFRAGAYYIEPSKYVIEVLKEIEILCDSSVTKGLNTKGFFDYRDASNNIIPWQISNQSVKYSGDSGMIEFPIYSEIGFESPAIKKFFPKLYYLIRYGIDINDRELIWAKERDKIKGVRYPRSNRVYKKNEAKDINHYVKQILGKQAIQLDYDYMPASVFVKVLENVFNHPEVKKLRNKNITIPVIASGHIKDAFSNDNLKWILEKINKNLENEVKYWTLSEAYNNYKPSIL